MELTILHNLKRSITQIVREYHLNVSGAPTGRPRKIPIIDALALALYQHGSSRATKISVYRDVKKEVGCSYKTFVVSINSVAVLATTILVHLMQMNKMQSHLVKYTDATDIPVCLKKNADSHKTMSGLASFGRSTKGWYYGVKMTMTRDALGRILGFRFTSANANDREVFQTVNKDIYGIIVADAGYVSKQLEKDMNLDGKRWVFIRPYKTMKKLATRWQHDLYRGRFQIEFDFRSLKLFHGLVTSLPRSVNGYLANYLYALLSFILS